MAKKLFNDDQVEKEIERLQASPMVRLAKKEESIRNRRRQYMYVLRGYEKRGIALAEQGITLDNIESSLCPYSEESVDERS